MNKLLDDITRGIRNVSSACSSSSQERMLEQIRKLDEISRLLMDAVRNGRNKEALELLKLLKGPFEIQVALARALAEKSDPGTQTDLTFVDFAFCRAEGENSQGM